MGDLVFEIHVTGHVKDVSDYHIEIGVGDEAMIRVTKGLVTMGAGAFAIARGSAIPGAAIAGVVGGVGFDAIHSLISQDDKGIIKDLRKLLNNPNWEDFGKVIGKLGTYASLGALGGYFYSKWFSSALHPSPIEVTPPVKDTPPVEPTTPSPPVNITPKMTWGDVVKEIVIVTVPPLIILFTKWYLGWSY